MTATQLLRTLLVSAFAILAYAPNIAAAEPTIRKLIEISDDLNTPVAIAPDPLDSERLLIAEKSGLVISLNLRTGRTDEVIDIEELVGGTPPQGVLGIATNKSQEKPQLFITYVDPQGDLVIGRFVLSARVRSLDADSMTVVIKIARLHPHSLNSSLALGADGLLYIGVSDGEGGASPRTHTAQMPQSLLGKVIRIKPGEQLGYTIPADNPFFNHLPYQPEIWALGFRSPGSVYISPDTSQLFVLDGNERSNEINQVTRGQNYGWDSVEGNKCLLNECPKDSFTTPLLALPKESPGSQLRGGFLYSQAQYPELKNTLIFAETDSGKIYAAIGMNSSTPEVREVTRVPKGAITALGQGQRGTIYVGTDTGRIFAIQ